MPDAYETAAARPYALSQAGYYLDFVLSPACAIALFVAELQIHGARLLMRWAIAALVGLFAWSLAEYLIHAFVFHRVPGIRQAHDEHHRRPSAYIGVASIYTFAIFAALTTLTCIAAGISEIYTEGLTRGFYSGFTDGSGFMAGFLVGYLLYIVVHDAMHHREIGPGHWLYAAKMRHVAHHKGLEANFGIITTLWDRAFGTFKPVGANG